MQGCEDGMTLIADNPFTCKKELVPFEKGIRIDYILFKVSKWNLCVITPAVVLSLPVYTKMLEASDDFVMPFNPYLTSPRVICRDLPKRIFFVIPCPPPKAASLTILFHTPTTRLWLLNSGWSHTLHLRLEKTSNQKIRTLLVCLLAMLAGWLKDCQYLSKVWPTTSVKYVNNYLMDVQ